MDATKPIAPSALGLDPSDLYAYCYCEENVHRLLKRGLADSEGSWLRDSLITLVVDPRARTNMRWDYHVCAVVRVNSTGSLFVADFDSVMCNQNRPGTIVRLMPFADYCKATFAKASRDHTKFRVIPAGEYVKRLRTTRAHMLHPQMLQPWLSNKERRDTVVPAQLLAHQPPHPAEAPPNGDVDLAHFINMRESMAGGAADPAPGKVMDLKAFCAGEF